MITRGFKEVEIKKNDLWWTTNEIKEMKSFINSIDDNIIEANFTCSQALNQMKTKSVDCLLIFENEYFI
jgi:hypothetical protein